MGTNPQGESGFLPSLLLPHLYCNTLVLLLIVSNCIYIKVNCFHVLKESANIHGKVSAECVTAAELVWSASSPDGICSQTLELLPLVCPGLLFISSLFSFLIFQSQCSTRASLQQPAFPALWTQCPKAKGQRDTERDERSGVHIPTLLTRKKAGEAEQLFQCHAEIPWLAAEPRSPIPLLVPLPQKHPFF